MQKFTLLSHTADIGIEVKAKTLEEIFENAALGMFSIIADINQIKPRERLEIEIVSENLSGLLFNWLRELLYQFNTTYILCKEFSIKELSEKKLSAFVWGDKIENKKNIINTEIKAITYHEFKLEKENSFWKARVIFDV